MADKEKTDKLETAGLQSAQAVPEASKKAQVKKKPNFFKRLFGRIKRWFKELKSEAKKVTWPTFKQVVKNTLVVLACVLVVGAVIMLADLVFRSGLSLFIDLF